MDFEERGATTRGVCNLEKGSVLVLITRFEPKPHPSFFPELFISISMFLHVQ
jgi:hypothetical protein